METIQSLREEIKNLRSEIDRASCSAYERSFSESRQEVLTLLHNVYGGSSLWYTAVCTALPIAVCIAIFLLFVSSGWIQEKLMRRRVSQELCQSSILQDELRSRMLTQASRRAARGRTLFVLTIKCLIACAVLLLFMASRLVMVAAVRSWLLGIFVPPTNVNDEGLELYNAFFTLLRFDWMKDMQGLIVFSTIGSGIMIVGLRLLRSASDDAASLQCGSASLLHLITKIDNQHAMQKQNNLNRHMEELRALVAECMFMGPNQNKEEAHEPSTLDILESPADPIAVGKVIKCESVDPIMMPRCKSESVIAEPELSQGEEVSPNKESEINQEGKRRTSPSENLRQTEIENVQ